MSHLCYCPFISSQIIKLPPYRKNLPYLNDMKILSHLSFEWAEQALTFRSAISDGCRSVSPWLISACSGGDRAAGEQGGASQVPGARKKSTQYKISDECKCIFAWEKKNVLTFLTVWVNVIWSWLTASHGSKLDVLIWWRGHFWSASSSSLRNLHSSDHLMLRSSYLLWYLFDFWCHVFPPSWCTAVFIAPVWMCASITGGKKNACAET